METGGFVEIGEFSARPRIYDQPNVPTGFATSGPHNTILNVVPRVSSRSHLGQVRMNALADVLSTCKGGYQRYWPTRWIQRSHFTDTFFLLLSSQQLFSFLCPPGPPALKFLMLPSLNDLFATILRKKNNADEQVCLCFLCIHEHGPTFSRNRCNSCQKYFANVNHQRVKHRSPLVVQTLSGDRTVQRSSDGEFLCPNDQCNYQNINSDPFSVSGLG